MPNQGWRIDYFIVNKQIIEAVNECEIHDYLLGSDHVPISIDFTISKLKFSPPRGTSPVKLQFSEAGAKPLLRDASLEIVLHDESLDTHKEESKENSFLDLESVINDAILEASLKSESSENKSISINSADIQSV